MYCVENLLGWVCFCLWMIGGIWVCLSSFPRFFFLSSLWFSPAPVPFLLVFFLCAILCRAWCKRPCVALVPDRAILDRVSIAWPYVTIESLDTKPCWCIRMHCFRIVIIIYYDTVQSKSCRLLRGQNHASVLFAGKCTSPACAQMQ